MIQPKHSTACSLLLVFHYGELSTCSPPTIAVAMGQMIVGVKVVFDETDKPLSQVRLDSFKGYLD